MRALLAVIGDPDSDVGPPAAETLGGVPPDDIVQFLERGDPSQDELDVMSRRSEDHFVLEQVIRNRRVGNETLLRLASFVAGAPQDALIVNQVRLLRQPELIDALLGNPNLTADGRRRLTELREEFFEKEARRREQERLRLEEEERRARQEAAGIVFEEAAEEVAEPTASGTSEEAEAETGAEEEYSSANLAQVYRRIAAMTAKEKVEIAQKGTKSAGSSSPTPTRS